MTRYRFHTTPSVVVGRGSSAALDEVVGDFLGESVLLITDRGLCDLGLVDPAVAALRGAGATVTVFDAVEPDPSVKTVEAAVVTGTAICATGVLGLGGGSSLDVAKVVALRLGSGDALDTAWGVNNARGPRLRLVLVPTTAGTGSEVTPVAILTVGANEKCGISSPLLLPDLALLDADLTRGLPPAITASTGIDAMVHAIEAYASASPNNNPQSRMLAREALRMLGGNIETAVNDGTDVAAREAMLIGSMLAGQAFANSPVAAVHALAYPIGGMFHVPHGLSNALILTTVLRFNLSSATDLYSKIAGDAFPDIAKVAPELRAEAFVSALDNLIARLGMQTRLRDVGIPRAALPAMAASAMKQTRLLVNNPRPLSEADVLEIYAAAW